jgi:hypothetical protein
VEYATVRFDKSEHFGAPRTLAPEFVERLQALGDGRLHCHSPHCRATATSLRRDLAFCARHAEDARLDAQIARQREQHATMRKSQPEITTR